MSFQELGSLGELVGALAVLATLVYLAMQTRQTRIAAEQSAYFSQNQATIGTVEMYRRRRRDSGHRVTSVVCDPSCRG